MIYVIRVKMKTALLKVDRNMIVDFEEAINHFSDEKNINFEYIIITFYDYILINNNSKCFIFQRPLPHRRVKTFYRHPRHILLCKDH